VRTPGEVIDRRYVMGEMLGRGGMAEVFHATDTETDRGVAIKLLRSVEPGSVRRFRSEVDVLSRLDHPGLLKFLGSGTHEGVPYLVLDLADGPSLAAELANGPIGLDRALALGEEVADVLAYAHQVGVVHRDVKPSNILFDDLGRARLADFGIARVTGVPSLTGTGQLVGSAPYLAPEQVVGERAGPRSDVYSLGLVLIECLTGRVCYPGGYLEAALCRLHRPPDMPSDLPEWLSIVLASMVARDPVRRPTADAVADALGRGQAEPVVARTVPHDVHQVEAAALPDVLDVTAQQGLSTRLAVAANPTMAPQQGAPAHDPVRLPHGARPGRVGRRARATRQTTLLATVVMAVVLAVLGLMLVGDDPPARRPPSGAYAKTSITVPSNTVAPAAVAPTTVAPTTVAPTTATPTPAPPGTATPSTATPSTATPSTATPTTDTPTTATPTTAPPGTATPTTATPTTTVPTTDAPLQLPATDGGESPPAQGQDNGGGNAGPENGRGSGAAR
jgi:eukaryotic-like serine/threonine-protein kinase